MWVSRIFGRPLQLHPTLHPSVLTMSNLQCRMNSRGALSFERISVLTMSSREIAELTGKLHHHVMRDIKVMLDDLGEVATKFGGYYIAPNGKQRPCFNLPKRETMILVSGYSVVLRARIVDR